jgi:hypothetical protein
MSRVFIKNGSGKDVKNSQGERLFYSTTDGDSNPDRRQTVYREHKGLLGGSTKVKATYDPSNEKFNK